MSARQAITSDSSPTEVPDGAQAVYSGRQHLGWTFKRGKVFEAISYDRKAIGVYATIIQARNAVWMGES
jgi:hypothetical protein